tara:strand:+ start:2253 stop:4172 length:1920 start_codon:yes stop_codon:yes gene_type:complete
LRIASLFFLVNYITASVSLDIVNHSASVIIDGQISYQPFLGGLNYPRIEWIDLNGDSRNELFALDEDGCLRLYEYVDFEDHSFFEIIDTAYGGLCGMSWFNLRDFNQDGNLELICQSLESNNEVQIYNLIDGQFYLMGTVLDQNNNVLISDPLMVPTFADIDSDGDYDFFTGNIIGTVSFYENIGINNNLPVYQLGSLEWQNIWIVGPSQNRHGASAINFIDIDSDGDLDLFWGDYFQRSLYLIYNIGTSEVPNMDNSNIISDFPYNDPIYTTGRNMPSFNDIDSDGDLDLFISVLGGDGGIQLTNNLLLYENVNGNFYLNSDDFMNSIDLNSNSAPQMVDIDSDGDLDLFIGQDYDTSTFPIRGRIYFFRNIGNSNENIFELEENAFLGTDIGTSLVPSFADIDSDGDLDIFIGNYNGDILFYKNFGTSTSFDFIYESTLPNIDLQSYSSPSFSDIDSDGDLDLFIGDNSGKIYFYENIGNELEFQFQLIDDNFLNIDVGSRSAPNFIDMDSDGDEDLILGSHNQNIKIYDNLEGEYIQNECISIPYYGLNTKPYMYSNSSSIYNIIGISTGGLWNSQLIQNLSDLNSDGVLNIQDIMLISNYIIGQYPSLNICLADANYDRYVDLIDIIVLINQILD